MKKIAYILSIIFWGIACQTEDIPLFSVEESGIYFQRVSSYTWGGTAVTYTDSMVFSFASASAKMTEVKDVAHVVTMGKVKEFDRPFKVVIDKEGTTATEGVHYKVDLENLVVKAGESEAKIPITIYRTPDLLTNTFRIKLRLEENEYFKLLITDYLNTNQWNSSGDTLNGTTYLFVFNETYSEPWYYQLFGGEYFGTWTPNKFVVLNTVMNWTVTDWNMAGSGGAKITGGRFNFAAKQMQKYLQDKADAGDPVKDSDGNYMQLPAPNSVDYSKYEKN